MCGVHCSICQQPNAIVLALYTTTDYGSVNEVTETPTNWKVWPQMQQKTLSVQLKLNLTYQKFKAIDHHSKPVSAPSNMLHVIFGTSFVHHSECLSELFIPLSATFIWTCRLNLLHTVITFHHFFTVLCCSSTSSRFSYYYVRHTKLASSLVNF